MIENSAIDPKTVRDYYAHMLSVYEAHWVRKDTDPLMELARKGLCILGIEAGKHWMDYVTTNSFERKIYVPYEPGDSSTGWDLWAQIEVLAHECQHLHQADKAGPLGSIADAVGYLVDTPQRTAHEAEAYTTSAELHWWRYGVLEDWWISGRAEALKSYGVGDDDVRHILSHLRSAAATIRRGGIVSHAGKAAIEWLNKHAPELRA